MPLARWAAWPALCLLACHAVHAADERAAPAEEAPRPEPKAEPRPEPEAPKPIDWKWEGAIGPVVNWTPQYSGSASSKVSATPGFYLRYGRISISNASGFVTRRSKDDVFRGLGLDLRNDDRVRFNIALRLDRGRRSADVEGLTGKQNVRTTIRARSSATLQMDHGFKLAAGWSADLLGRGGGNVVDVGLGHDRRWSQFTTWGVSASASMADGRYMRSYYGVSEQESAASGHPVYTPGAGLHSVGIGTSWRTEVNDRWVALWGASAGRLIGPAARSPLTTKPQQWGLNGAVAWRF